MAPQKMYFLLIGVKTPVVENIAVDGPNLKLLQTISPKMMLRKLELAAKTTCCVAHQKTCAKILDILPFPGKKNKQNWEQHFKYARSAKSTNQPTGGK